MKKLWKQVRGQKAWKQMREWKQVEDKPQGLLYLEQSSKAFSILFLPTMTVRIRIGNALEFC